MIKKAAIILILMAASIVTTPTFAQESSVPKLISYQGRLHNSQGEPISQYADTSQPMTFRLYDAEIGGNLVWCQTTSNVGITDNGEFAVLLGQGTPCTDTVETTDIFEAFKDTENEGRFLEIQVGSDDPLDVRTQIVSAPYAMHAAEAVTTKTAEDANTLQGFKAEDFVTRIAFSDYETIYKSSWRLPSNVFTSSTSGYSVMFRLDSVESDGRPVELVLDKDELCDFTVEFCSRIIVGGTGGRTGTFMQLVRINNFGQETLIDSIELSDTSSTVSPPNVVRFIDRTLPAGRGAYTYELRGRFSVSSGGKVEFDNVAMIARVMNIGL